MSLLTNIKSYYKLDESSGNAADATGNGNTLTNSSVTYGTGKINNGAICSCDEKDTEDSGDTGGLIGSSSDY